MLAIKFILICLFLPILLIFLLGWIIYWRFWAKKESQRKKQRKELKKKLLAHIHNFSPARLKNKTWQKSIGKSKKKPNKQWKTRNTKNSPTKTPKI